ncbi:ADP-ribosyl-[dinitrogen reductase] glycohydrolase [Biomphalaria pfeifferi]|uniref:ADP-ribosyl-[dinitrogen reductase] glycohydrolase n=1 Tax=Biomphalaria pfeifferi TaxID=112525 RepID=A0AAD8BYT0_BIOPF|nr:ADP-ribosyl-[dinitrogen reductase] glycohydrolase [Biomphalaria pfeifferi]
MDNTIKDQIRATILGQCVGDAIGLLTEFLTKDEAKKYYGSKPKTLEYSQKVPDFHRSRWSEGDWTDDSDHMILILQSLLYCKGQVNVCDFAFRIKRWMKNGFPELGDLGGMGIGATTHAILNHPNFILEPQKIANECWERSQRNIAPNGAVMRTSILGLHQWEDLEAVRKNVIEISKTTHADPRCQASCVAVSCAIALMLRHTQTNLSRNKPVALNVEDIVQEAYNRACLVLEKVEQKTELHFYMNCRKLKKLQLSEHGKIGYTYKCLGSGFWALRQENFQKALIKLVMEGGDADTNAAVAGAMLGCKLGLTAMPESWVTGLKHKDWLVRYIDRFLKLQEEMKLPLDERTSHDDLDCKVLEDSDKRQKEKQL